LPVNPKSKVFWSGDGGAIDDGGFFDKISVHL
jgi:hypothetical protein